MAKSSRNKTIDTGIDEGAEYLDRCLKMADLLKENESLDPDRRIGVAPVDKTVNGDTFDLMKMLPEGFADLAVVDPPYNLYKNYNGLRFGKKDAIEYEKFTRSWLEELKPLLKSTGTVYVCCDWESSLIIGRVLGDYFTVRNRITWQREKGRGARSNWKNSMEDIWFATVSDDYVFNLADVKIRRKVVAPYRNNGVPKDWDETEEGNYRDTCPSNFWDDLTVPFWSMSENTAHPAQKPEKLIAKLILASTNEGDVVFDPFLGSGTTSVTAKKLGRKYLGIEENPLYCIWTEQRLEMADRDKRIQGYEDSVFWERNAIGK